MGNRSFSKIFYIQSDILRNVRTDIQGCNPHKPLKVPEDKLSLCWFVFFPAEETKLIVNLLPQLATTLILVSSVGLYDRELGLAEMSHCYWRSQRSHIINNSQPRHLFYSKWDHNYLNWTSSCIKENVKVPSGVMISELINQVRSLALQCEPTNVFWNQWSVPLLAVRYDAGLGRRCSHTQTQQLHPFTGFRLWLTGLDD